MSATAGLSGPQNCTLRMSGTTLSTGVSRELSKPPASCAGSTVVVADPGPPLTTTADTSVVEVQVPPVAVPSVITTGAASVEDT